MKKIIITETTYDNDYISVIDNIILNIDKDNKQVLLKTSFDRNGAFQMNKKKVNELIKKLNKALKALK